MKMRRLCRKLWSLLWERASFTVLVLMFLAAFSALLLLEMFLIEEQDQPANTLSSDRSIYSIDENSIATMRRPRPIVAEQTPHIPPRPLVRPSVRKHHKPAFSTSPIQTNQHAADGYPKKQEYFSENLPSTVPSPPYLQIPAPPVYPVTPPLDHKNTLDASTLQPQPQILDSFVEMLLTPIITATPSTTDVQSNQVQKDTESVLHARIEEKLPSLGNIQASDGSWQNVTGTKYKFFVFSAYYEHRGQRAVRVIAATKTRGPERVWCRFWYHVNSSSPPLSVSVQGKVRAIKENWGYEYSPSFVLCPLRDNQTVPQSVSVVRSLGESPSNLLVVQRPSPTPSGDLAVCIRPLHNNYNQTLRLIEFLELTTLLGASHFFFYQHQSSRPVGCVLQQYRRAGRATVLPWHLDLPSDTPQGIHLDGIYAALNDCLYRAMYHYKYLAFLDVNEFIIPQQSDTLLQLLQKLEKHKDNQSIGGYSFQNAYFYLQWPDDWPAGETDVLETNLMTMLKNWRVLVFSPNQEHSKPICRPDRVVEVGKNFKLVYVAGNRSLQVAAEQAFLHNYSVCETGGDNCVNMISTVDRSVRDRYRDRLLDAVRKSWRENSQVCGLWNLTRREPPSSVGPPVDNSFWWRS